ncbi:ABC transporter ATP-binding protein [Methylocaldum sp. MU1018]
MVGIIGHNGAGKSTLLKLLANISKPSRGRVSVKGSVAPLIEVGAGINPELTGRENIFLNSAILGIPKRETVKKFDEIVAFAELEQFIDTPVKRYSSGMQVKLGFSIATNMDAEILIIDEVLAVGDLAFQRKCFDRMETLIKKQSKTVLLVSHNLRQIARMCSRAIMLNQGRIELDGNPNEVCNAFYEFNNQKILAEHEHRGAKNIHANDVLRLEKVEILDKTGTATERIHTGDPLTVRIVFDVKRKIEKPEVVVGTHTTDFIYLTANSTDALSEWPDFEPGTYDISCKWQNFPLRNGVYCIRLVIFDQFRGPIFSEEGIKYFQVVSPEEAKNPPLRLLDIDSSWRINGKEITSDSRQATFA